MKTLWGIWKKTVRAILSPIGIAFALTLVGIWTRDWRWALTGVVLLGFVTWVLVLSAAREAIKEEAKKDG